MRVGVLLALTAALAACDAASEPPEPLDPSIPEPGTDAATAIDLDEPFDASGLRYDCAIGVADGGDGGPRDPYLALEPGGPIPIRGVGQAGLTARLTYRCTPVSDVDPALEEADVELILTNAYTEVVAPRMPEPVPASLHCSGLTCDGARQIEISHLAKLPQLEGLKVRADLRVLSAEGELLGRDRNHGVLAPR